MAKIDGIEFGIFRSLPGEEEESLGRSSSIIQIIQAGERFRFIDYYVSDRSTATFPKFRYQAL
jgi:hypothetical protein